MAEVIYLNSVNRNFTVTLVSEGIDAGTASRLGFRLVDPSEFPTYVQDRLEASAAASLGIIRYSAETLPLFDG